MDKHLKKRHFKEFIFRLCGISSLTIACLLLVIILGTIINQARHAVYTSYIQMELTYKESESPQVMVKRAILAATNASRAQRRDAFALISGDAWIQAKNYLDANPTLKNGDKFKVWLLADDEADQYLRDLKEDGYKELEEKFRTLSDQKIAWLDGFKANNQFEARINDALLFSVDSRNPELAGLLGALVGSFWTMLVTLSISFPIAVLAAIYLEEFSPKNKFADMVEINVNNLAAVPSIIYGLLGLAVFLNFFGMPRSAPIVGGFVLSLMTIPIIIIAARGALRAIPPSIRQAALAVGASPIQMVVHHLLPYSMPGILTGVIVGMSRALGETAPLLMIGMAAFIADVPKSMTDASSALPVQIYLWADSPQAAFASKTSAAIIVLLCFLLLMNGTAIWLRQKFEKKW